MGNNGVTPDECRFLKIKNHGNLKIYCMDFMSASEIQLFLSEDPPVNKGVFFDMKSVSAKEQFAGEPLEQAIRYCVGGYEKNYDQFLEMAQMLENANTVYMSSRKVETSFVGQRPNVPAYIAGAPKTMYRTGKVEEKKFIDVVMNVTYDNSTTESQIQHRGILTLNLIRILEKNGYIVNFRLYEVSKNYNEAFVCEVTLKKPGDKLDSRLCYYPMCGKGFVRRIISRVKESMPFEENWGLSYGTVPDERSTKSILNIINEGVSKETIFIGSPKEMNIAGDDLFEDADAFVVKLGIEDMIKIPKYMELK